MNSDSRNGNGHQHLVLRLSCENKVGIVAAVAKLIADVEGNILDSSQFDDRSTGKFFMRTEFELVGEQGLPAFQNRFARDVAKPFDMFWSLHDKGEKVRALVLVSKGDHCLEDLLYRSGKGTLPIEVTAVASNHQSLRPNAQSRGIPFHYLPIVDGDKAAQEAQVLGLMKETGAELLILARYMQILSPELCRQLRGRAINIHHSFLPGFKGAKPYHRAHDRGVKLIGATAHYVTEDLDEGPIIEQAVEPVSHRDYPEDLIALGRDIESKVLSRAVRLHAEHRVFLNGIKTVVL
ncbi:formyltetrahydrofolate deformylase [Magnetospira sp. QH-2]|uniref:formyltetrahydrofolate deformylase n=1 Tax=Magnetospira sp. (strain QH-2) TaxID=1288970 RepID=UPI0003E80B8F|nr:formyltetrahydrofolate deformylase [Magnetospira sp. QH-2]CCQ73029.1 Formyltetrahydrofolate deformylase (Formyl-FH(4) hydrolase) [Magnetospira sp. QH-2]